MSRFKEEGSRQALNLLIVDDDMDDIELVRQALVSLDLQISLSVAYNGQEALSFLDNVENPVPDIILMDLRMPRMDGKKCLLSIRENPVLKNIPIIIYTTSQDEEESIELINHGAVHFISKPSNPDDVYYMLSLVIEERMREMTSQGN